MGRSSNNYISAKAFPIEIEYDPIAVHRHSFFKAIFYRYGPDEPASKRSRGGTGT